MVPLRPAAGLAASVLLVSLGGLPAQAPAPPAAARASAITSTSPAGVIVQMFDWPWTAIAAECTSVLGPDGYAAVQISPPQEAVVLAADGYPWWQAYQPVSYGLTSRFGTQAQLVDGFRWDSAKEMDPADIAAIEALLTRPVPVYQDVEYGAGQPVTPDQYEGTGSLLEYRYGWDLYDAFTSGTLASLSDFGPSWNPAGMVPSGDAVVFVDDQDTERDGGALSYASGPLYTLASVFMLGWDYGTPMVLSDYAFSGYDQGPPQGGGNAIAPHGCGSGTWECEQRWPAIAGMVGWHNAAGTAPVANWWSDGRDAIAFSRGSSAWVAINAESSPVTEDFSTGLAAGRYCDVISGAAAAGVCTGATITVGAGGQAVVTVPALSAVGIDVAAQASPRVSNRATPRPGTP